MDKNLKTPESIDKLIEMQAKSVVNVVPTQVVDTKSTTNGKAYVKTIFRTTKRKTKNN